jgi:hypothetical protein
VVEKSFKKMGKENKKWSHRNAYPSVQAIYLRNASPNFADASTSTSMTTKISNLKRLQITEKGKEDF